MESILFAISPIVGTDSGPCSRPIVQSLLVVTEWQSCYSSQHPFLSVLVFRLQLATTTEIVTSIWSLEKSKALANLVFRWKKTCDELFGYTFVNFGKNHSLRFNCRIVVLDKACVANYLKMNGRWLFLTIQKKSHWKQTQAETKEITESENLNSNSILQFKCLPSPSLWSLTGGWTYEGQRLWAARQINPNRQKGWKEGAKACSL